MRNVRTLDLSILPEQAQTELVDFYEFLFQKYGEASDVQKEEREEKFAHFLANPIQVKQLQSWTREELHDR